MSLSAGMLVVSIFISLIGLALLAYGRKQTRLPHMAAGLILLVFPYFVGRWWIAVIVSAVVLAGLAVVSKLGY